MIETGRLNREQGGFHPSPQNSRHLYDVVIYYFEVYFYRETNHACCTEKLLPLLPEGCIPSYMFIDKTDEITSWDAGSERYSVRIGLRFNTVRISKLVAPLPFLLFFGGFLWNLRRSCPPLPFPSPDIFHFSLFCMFQVMRVHPSYAVSCSITSDTTNTRAKLVNRPHDMSNAAAIECAKTFADLGAKTFKLDRHPVLTVEVISSRAE